VNTKKEQMALIVAERIGDRRGILKAQFNLDLANIRQQALGGYISETEAGELELKRLSGYITLLAKIDESDRPNSTQRAD
jgi:hypothetical protein